jgi:hypothetical protein
VRQLNHDLALTNAGLVDTIADSLQAAEVARADAEAQCQRLHRLVAEAPGPDCRAHRPRSRGRVLLVKKRLRLV